MWWWWLFKLRGWTVIPSPRGIAWVAEQALGHLQEVYKVRAHWRRITGAGGGWRHNQHQCLHQPHPGVRELFDLRRCLYSYTDRTTNNKQCWFKLKWEDEVRGTDFNNVLWKQTALDTELHSTLPRAMWYRQLLATRVRIWQTTAHIKPALDTPYDRNQIPKKKGKLGIRDWEVYRTQEPRDALVQQAHRKERAHASQQRLCLPPSHSPLPLLWRSGPHLETRKSNPNSLKIKAFV